MEITAQFQQVAVTLYQEGFVSSLEEMAASFSPGIEICRVRAVNIMHDLTQLGLRGLDNQVIMIGHKNICVKDKAIFLLSSLYILLEFFIIRPGLVNLSSLVSPGCDVIKSTFIYHYLSNVKG